MEQIAILSVIENALLKRQHIILFHVTNFLREDPLC